MSERVLSAPSWWERANRVVPDMCSRWLKEHHGTPVDTIGVDLSIADSFAGTSQEDENTCPIDEVKHEHKDGCCSEAQATGGPEVVTKARLCLEKSSWTDLLQETDQAKGRSVSFIDDGHTERPPGRARAPKGVPDE